MHFRFTVYKLTGITEQGGGGGGGTCATPNIFKIINS